MKKDQKKHADDKCTREHFDLLVMAFLRATQICKAAAGLKVGLTIDDLIDFSDIKEKMDTPEEHPASHFSFEGWPKTPGTTFSIFARDSARELAGAFVARVALILSATDCDNVLLRLKDKENVELKELDHWAESAFLEFQKTFDLMRPLEFSRDCDSLFLRLEAEADTYFAKPQEPGRGKTETSKANEAWSKPMSKSRMMSALGINSLDSFNSFAKIHGTTSINHKLHQIRLDKMSPKDREKLEKI